MSKVQLTLPLSGSSWQPGRPQKYRLSAAAKVYTLIRTGQLRSIKIGRLP
jgi:hypothetical protein